MCPAIHVSELLSLELKEWLCYSHCSALPAFLQILPHQMHRPLLTKLDRWTVPYKTFLFIIQKEEQTPSNEAFGCAKVMRYNSFLGQLDR